MNKLPVNDLDLVFIENVGNLVCPSAFDLGESGRVVVLSIPEGDDKPAKYPGTFANADVILINKIDLISYLKFDLQRVLSD
ncbi:MAG TPA: GTP-binding protein, partial [Anaerohalosphaeraceae bacterium]|nr:GTP-binding protein [Anaerohalosphaeraceae bacterium]